MRLFTARDSALADARAVEEHRVPSLVLMENAGRHVAAVAAEAFRPLSSVVVLCGKGNNGGDGFVAARHLVNWGIDVQAWIVGSKAGALTGDARANFEAAAGCGVRVKEFSEDQELAGALSSADLVIDALLGTGFKGRMTGALASASRLVNGSGRRVLCVDVPSGVEADTGKADEHAVRCRVTVTFDTMKVCHVQLPGARYCGDVLAVDISIPPGASPGERERMDIICGWEVGRALEAMRRDPAAHKGTAGHVILACGSRGYAGAAVMTARGALRAGAGLVTLAVPAGIQDVVASKLDEAITLGLPDEGGMVAPGAAEMIRGASSAARALALGPGLGRGLGVKEFVTEAVEASTIPTVVDADALNALSETGPPGKNLGHFIMTPHPGEAARLLGSSVREVQADRLGAALKISATWGGATVILKGARTVVARAGPAPRVAVCPVGNPGMASGGMGDVLTGVVAALAAQCGSVWNACVTGSYLHGLAGDMALLEVRGPGILARDLVKRLGEAFGLCARAAEAKREGSGGDLPGCIGEYGMRLYGESTATGRLMWQLALMDEARGVSLELA